MIQCFPAGTRATIPDVCETTTSSAASLSETTSALRLTYSVNKTITTKSTTSHTATLSTVPALPTLSSFLSHIPSDTEPTSSTLSAEQTIDISDQTTQSSSFVNTEALTTTTPPFSHTSAYSESSSTSTPTTYRVSPTILHQSTLVSDTSSSSNALTLTSLTTFEETTLPITATPATVLTKASTKPTVKLQTTDSNMNSSRLMLTMSLPLNRTGSSIESTLKSYTATHTLSNDTLLATEQSAGSDSGVNHSSDIPNTSGDSNIATVTVTDTKHSTPIATLGKQPPIICLYLYLICGYYYTKHTFKDRKLLSTRTFKSNYCLFKRPLCNKNFNACVKVWFVVHVTDENDGGGDNSGVIIGITVAIVLLMVVVVGILVVCLWHR